MKRRNESTRIILAAWLCLVLFILAFLVFSALASPASAITIRDSFYFIMGVTTMTALIVAAVKARGRDKRLWILIAIAGTLWAAGDFILRICEAIGILGPLRVLSLPDAFYFPAYVILIAVVVLLGHATEKGGSRFKWVRFYPPAVIVLSVIISLAMAVFLPHGVAGSQIGEPAVNLPLMVNYSYTALDVCVVGGLLLIILVNKAHFTRLWLALLVLGLSTFAIADLSYSLFKPAGIYDPTNLPTQIIMAMWLTAYGLLSIAAVYKMTENPITS